MTKARKAIAEKAAPHVRAPKKDTVRELAEVVYNATLDAKARDVAVLDLRKISTFADYLIIASGTSTRQVQAIADRVREITQTKARRRPLGVEGTENAKWILIDYGDVVCHVFEEETRKFYRLENLWHDAKQVKLGKKKTTKK